MLNEAFVHEFRRNGAALVAGRERLQAELGALLAERGIEVHLVSGRVKSEVSLRRKLGRPDRTYAALWDVTDLVGLRVTTYFEDAIDEVARAVEERFEVDFEHSIDKLRVKDQGRPYFEFTRVQWRLAAKSLERVQRGYGLFFLSHSAILRSGELEISKVEKLTQLYRELDYPDDERAARRFASGLLAALQPAGEGTAG